LRKSGGSAKEVLAFACVARKLWAADSHPGFSMANHAPHHLSLVTEIAERRQRLDQTFYEHIRRLRREHGDRAVDQALATWQQQRNQVSAAAATKGRPIGSARPGRWRA
jgi:hypothetical protein